MPFTAASIVLDEAEEVELRRRVAAAITPQRDAKRAMRRQINRGDVLDPAITAHYHAARDELDAARDERRIADTDYHAYHRMLMAQTLSRSRLQAQSASTDDDA